MGRGAHTIPSRLLASAFLEFEVSFLLSATKGLSTRIQHLLLEYGGFLVFFFLNVLSTTLCLSLSLFFAVSG